jgi:hypothetical protein
MEINQINGDVKGVVVTADTVEGRMVCFTSHSESEDYGSLAGLPGAKVPSTADEAKKARWIVTFPVASQKPPFYTPMPGYDWAMRGGWDQSANVPFDASVALTYPGYQHSKTIPSGTRARAFGAGTYTIPSGQYVYSASLVVGASVSVAYSGGNEGKLQYAAAYDADTIVGIVEAVDASTLDLTVTLGLF